MIYSITHEGISVPVNKLRAFIGASQTNQIFTVLKITAPRKIGRDIVRRVYKLEGGMAAAAKDGTADPSPRTVYLPRSFATLLGAQQLAMRAGIHIPLGKPDWRLRNPSLYESHEVVVKHLMKKIYTADRIAVGKGSTSFEMRAGTGKTFLAAGLIAALGQRTLYIVPKKPLVEQAAADFTKTFAEPAGDGEIIDDESGDEDSGESSPTLVAPTIAKWNGQKKNMDAVAAAADIVIMVVNSVLLRPKEFFDGFGLVVFDEVHEYCTDSFMNVFWKTAAVPCLFGMTATPDKEFSNVFRYHLGSVISAESIKGFEYPPNNFRCVCRQIEWYGPDSHSKNLTHENTGKIFTQYMHEQAIDDEARLRLAVSELQALYDWRGPDGQMHHIYVFAEQISILRTLRDAFHLHMIAAGRQDIAADMASPELGADAPIDDAKLAMFTGGIKKDALEKVAAESRVLFTTYGYGGTGISYTKMTAMMFETSRKANMLQILGRILRSGSDESIPRVVVDIIDMRTALRWQIKHRQPAYDFYGFKKQTIKAYHEKPIPPGWSG